MDAVLVSRTYCPLPGDVEAFPVVPVKCKTKDARVFEKDGGLHLDIKLLVIEFLPCFSPKTDRVLFCFAVALSFAIGRNMSPWPVKFPLNGKSKDHYKTNIFVCNRLRGLTKQILSNTAVVLKYVEIL